MNDQKLISRAEEFLKSRRIGFVRPGKIGEIENSKIEIIFPVPETLDPEVAIVEPPDVRVWVYPKSDKVELIEQM